jgi:hypothetical protein
LNLVGASPLVGHCLNMLGVVAIVWLLFSIVRRIAGTRAGLFAGVVFSGLGALPVLVGWVSGIQDILAMVFVLAAIHMELEGRSAMGPILFVGALASKETSMALLPALLFVGSLGEGRAWPAPRKLISYGAICAAWAAIHPGTRLLLSGGLHGGSGAYLGTPSVSGIENLRNAALTLINIPLGPGSREQFQLLALPLGLALALVWLAYGWTRRTTQDARRPALVTWGHLILLAGLMTLPPLLMAGLFVQHWSPYYTCVSALGVSILSGAWLARVNLKMACLLVSAYLCLGAWSRKLPLFVDM